EGCVGIRNLETRREIHIHTVRTVRIPPTQLVDRSYLAYDEPQLTGVFPNPTNAVGGSFIFSLRRTAAHRRFSKSHQRSWWIVHTQPRRAVSQASCFQSPTNNSWCHS